MPSPLSAYRTCDDTSESGADGRYVPREVQAFTPSPGRRRGSSTTKRSRQRVPRRKFRREHASGVMSTRVPRSTAATSQLIVMVRASAGHRSEVHGLHGPDVRDQVDVASLDDVAVRRGFASALRRIVVRQHQAVRPPGRASNRSNRPTHPLGRQPRKQHVGIDKGGVHPLSSGAAITREDRSVRGISRSLGGGLVLPGSGSPNHPLGELMRPSPSPGRRQAAPIVVASKPRRTNREAVPVQGVV